jgi:hypothetical protein
MEPTCWTPRRAGPWGQTPSWGQTPLWSLTPMRYVPAREPVVILAVEARVACRFFHDGSARFERRCRVNDLSPFNPGIERERHHRRFHYVTSDVHTHHTSGLDFTANESQCDGSEPR